MAKYKVGDIFINHKDGKILQVCEGNCYEGCCYFSHCWGPHPYPKDTSCYSLIGLDTCFKELPSLPPGTKVKVRENLKVGTMYGQYIFVGYMEQNKEVTIRDYYASHKAYIVAENRCSYTFEMFDQVINEPKTNNMETKEIKIKVPEGYEIDKENSTFECIKFKPIKKVLTYKDMAEELFNDTYYFTDRRGKIDSAREVNSRDDKNNATHRKQLERLMALNQLLNIAEYYNKKSPKKRETVYCINMHEEDLMYYVRSYTRPIVVRGLIPTFNNIEDAEAVINNPNFKGILDLLYKGNEY